MLSSPAAFHAASEFDDHKERTGLWVNRELSFPPPSFRHRSWLESQLWCPWCQLLSFPWLQWALDFILIFLRSLRSVVCKYHLSLLGIRRFDSLISLENIKSLAEGLLEKLLNINIGLDFQRQGKEEGPQREIRPLKTMGNVTGKNSFCFWQSSGAECIYELRYITYGMSESQKCQLLQNKEIVGKRGLKHLINMEAASVEKEGLRSMWNWSMSPPQGISPPSQRQPVSK